MCIFPFFSPKRALIVCWRVDILCGCCSYPGSVRRAPPGSSGPSDKHPCGARSDSCKSYRCCHTLISCGACSSEKRGREKWDWGLFSFLFFVCRRTVSLFPQSRHSPLCTGSWAPPSRWPRTLCRPRRTRWRTLCSCSAAPGGTDMDGLYRFHTHGVAVPPFTGIFKKVARQILYGINIPSKQPNKHKPCLINIIGHRPEYVGALTDRAHVC